MKKAVRYLTVLVLCAAILCVMLVFAPKPFTRHISALPQDAHVAIYCRNTSLPSIDMGNGRLVQCALADFYHTLESCNGIDGISVRFAATQADFDEILTHFNVQVTSCYRDGNLIAVCGHSAKILGGVNVDGNFVNLQVAYDGNTLTIGYPLILDSY